MSLFSSNDEHFCTPFALRNQTNTKQDQVDINRLEPENDYGNVEYKLKLINPTPERVERLVTQLKWRIREGQGEAILFLGVKDNGTFVGLTPEEIRLSLQTLETMSSKIGATTSIVEEHLVETTEQNEAQNLESIMLAKGRTIRNKAAYVRQYKENLSTVPKSDHASSIGEVRVSKKNNVTGKSQKRLPTRKVLQVLVKRKTHDISEELRVAVLGPTDSGKSSLLGVLSHGEYDNGRGSARLNLFRHRHEVRSGHTSSISQEIFGFTCHGQPLTYNTCLTTEEIIESSSRIVTLIDLAGHQRYLSTTLFGLGSHSPDLVLIVISATSAITSLISDHISLALGMERSVAIVVNKTDLVSNENLDDIYNEITKVLHHLHPDMITFRTISLNDAIVAGSRLGNPKILPIFFSSCVTGSGLSSLYTFFNEISPKLNVQELNQAISQSSELQVDETFEVPGIGTVVSGLMTEGIIREGDKMLLGPDDLGNFSNVSIISLQRHKIPCNFARAGQRCTMAIKVSDTKVRKGMVMKEIDPEWRHNFSICRQFEAEIRFITNEHIKLSQGSQVSAYIGNVKQTCIITAIESKQDDDCFIVDLKLTKRPEYIRQGSRIIIRHTKTKGVGVVRNVRTICIQND